MRILYIDIDSLRHDHLQCYGYQRNTAPNIDSIADAGVRFDNVYVSDAPCLPSRTALITGRFGIHTGVCNHHGTAADMYIEGPPVRRFTSQFGNTSWARCLQNAGYRTITFSPFAKRHSAWWWYAGFDETHSYGSPGANMAHDDASRLISWLDQNGREDNWFVHVNFWDVHFPYRTPEEYANPFMSDPIPEWYTEEVRQRNWNGCGVSSAQDLDYFRGKSYSRFPRQPSLIDSMDKVRQMFDGYDTSLRYVDDHLGMVFRKLGELGIQHETAIVISADHGEDLGELNVHCDHRSASEYTNHVPLIIHWPGITDQPGIPRCDSELHYHIDFGATLLEFAGANVPDNWDGKSFSESFREGSSEGRPYLVLTYGGTAAIQRSVRFNEGDQSYLCIRNYHDGWYCQPDVMLYELNGDPHLQKDLANERPEVINQAMFYLTQWQSDMMRTATHPTDPIWTAMLEGPQDMVLAGSDHLAKYIEHLRNTDRAHYADELQRKFGKRGF